MRYRRTYDLEKTTETFTITKTESYSDFTFKYKCELGSFLRFKNIRIKKRTEMYCLFSFYLSHSYLVL